MKTIMLAIILLALINPGEADPTYLYHVCSNATIFSPNGTYRSSLTTLLSALSSSSDSRAAASSAGAVHGQFLCRGDVNATACRGCVEFAVRDAVKRCPVEQEIVIWYDECQLRYSNRSFLGFVADRPHVALLNTANVTEPEKFNLLLNKTMKVATSAAAEADTRFATAEAQFNGFQTLYTLAQCTPDLAGEDCRRCLSEAVARLPACCFDKLGGRVLFPSCNVRYEFYPFYFTEPPSFTPATGNIAGSKILTATIVGIVVPVSVLMAILAVGLFFCLRKRAQDRNVKDNPKEFKIASASDLSAAKVSQFDLATIKSATNNFTPDNKIGFGFVDFYKGIFGNGQQIAVKRVPKKNHAIEEFKNEILILAQLQHQNLVKLLGFCSEGKENLLVYEFMPNKTLDLYIFHPKKQLQLDWSARFNIIRGIARGISYLHEGSQNIIIHRDLKPESVLLDGDMNPRISRFGLARILGADQEMGNTSTIVGTFGYISPEYAMHGQYSIKSDVYSFGVTILEIISGKRNKFYESDRSQDLTNYAWKLWKEETPLELLGSTVMNSYSEKQIVQCIHIGLLCVQEDPKDRPTINTIDLMFDSDDSVTLPEPENPAFYDRAE